MLVCKSPATPVNMTKDCHVSCTMTYTGSAFLSESVTSSFSRFTDVCSSACRQCTCLIVVHQSLKSPLDYIYTPQLANSWQLHNIISARVAVSHSQSLVWWLSMLCQIRCVTLQSTHQPWHTTPKDALLLVQCI